MLFNELSGIEKKILSIFLIILFIFVAYIIYLNSQIFGLKSDMKSQEKIYSIQINNRIDEIMGLTQQVDDLHRIMNVGLTINSELKQQSSNDNKISDYLFNIIPNGFPTNNIQVTSNYGYRIHPINLTESLHSGIDLKSNVGENVYSTAVGIVVKTITNDNSGYGKYIIIQNAFGFSTLFAHLDDIIVKEGDFVSKNSLIGYSGNTGRSTGPHLHYEVRFMDKHINPIDFIYWNKKTFNSIFYTNTHIKWSELISILK